LMEAEAHGQGWRFRLGDKKRMWPMVSRNVIRRCHPKKLPRPQKMDPQAMWWRMWQNMKEINHM
jgi:hypothetical protein